MIINSKDIDKYSKIGHHRSGGKKFLIKRKLLIINGIENGVNLYYWIYIQKKLLWLKFWLSICEGTFRVSKDSIEEAKNFINKEYPQMKKCDYSCPE